MRHKVAVFLLILTAAIALLLWYQTSEVASRKSPEIPRESGQEVSKGDAFVELLPELTAKINKLQARVDQLSAEIAKQNETIGDMQSTLSWQKYRHRFFPWSNETELPYPERIVLEDDGKEYSLPTGPYDVFWILENAIRVSEHAQAKAQRQAIRIWLHPEDLPSPGAEVVTILPEKDQIVFRGMIYTIERKEMDSLLKWLAANKQPSKD